MNDPTPFRRIAVVAGAVGSWFGAMLARAGHAVVLIGRAPHVEAIRRDGLRVESQAGSGPCASRPTPDIAAVRGADLAFCVKSPDTDAVARAMAPHLDANALVLSLQNGVDNAATIARRALRRRALVVYVATALPAPGTVAHTTAAAISSSARKTRRCSRACARWSSCSPARRCRCWFARRDGRAVAR